MQVHLNRNVITLSVRQIAETDYKLNDLAGKMNVKKIAIGLFACGVKSYKTSAVCVCAVM